MTEQELIRRYEPDWSQRFDSKIITFMSQEPNGGYVRYSDYAALRQQLEKAREVKPLEWSEERRPDGGEASYYTHVVAQSPLGEILIEWKGWKDHDSPTCHLPWGEFICGYDLADCKAKVHEAFQRRYNAMSREVE